jgi:hypothetical protein
VAATSTRAAAGRTINGKLADADWRAASRTVTCTAASALGPSGVP